MARATRSRPARRTRGRTPAQAGAFDPITGRFEAPSVERFVRGIPQRLPIPSIADLVRLSNVDLSAAIKRFGVGRSWPELRSSAAAYVQRMTSYPPGSEQFQVALNDLVRRESRRGLLGTAREVYQGYTRAQQERNFGANQVYIRIDEGDENECENCVRLAGFEGTMQQQAAVGLPGAASCLGGSLCRCELIAIG